MFTRLLLSIALVFMFSSQRFAFAACGDPFTSVPDEHLPYLTMDAHPSYLSTDGRYMAFGTLAPNLVAGDTNDKVDVFVYDSETCELERVSEPMSGELEHHVYLADMSGDARYVVYTSDAPNLVPNDTNGVIDVFVYDRNTKLRTRVSVASDGTQANAGLNYFAPPASITNDGRFVVFTSNATNLSPFDTNTSSGIFHHDRETGITTVITYRYPQGGQIYDNSYQPTISHNGRYIVFLSHSTSILGWEEPTARPDAYLFDAHTREVIRVSNPMLPDRKVNRPVQDVSISGNGRYVVYASRAFNIVENDLEKECMEIFFDGGQFPPTPQPASCFDIFRYDWITNETVRVSVSQTGGSPNGDSILPSISDDGRFIQFMSEASNIVPQDEPMNTCPKPSPNPPRCADIFVRDMLTGRTVRVSETASGEDANAESRYGSISGDGTVVGFASEATNFVTAGGYMYYRREIDPFQWSLIQNGDFAAGMTNWGVYDAITFQVANGRFEFFRNTTGLSAVVLQDTHIPLPADAGLDIQFEMGNSSSVRKRFVVLVHANDFSDLQVCSFWIPANTAPRVYTMRTSTKTAWGSAVLSFYASNPDGAGWLMLDNVALFYQAELPTAQTICFDPGVPSLPAP